MTYRSLPLTKTIPALQQLFKTIIQLLEKVKANYNADANVDVDYSNDNANVDADYSNDDVDADYFDANVNANADYF